MLDFYDEDRDGVITFIDRGKGTVYGSMPYGMYMNAIKADPSDILRYRFLLATAPLKLLKKEWNRHGHEMGEHDQLANAIARAYTMSKSDTESPDPLFKGMVWGKGKWPSVQYAFFRQICAMLYGPGFPGRFDYLATPYGLTLRYADKSCRYCSTEAVKALDDIVGLYHADIAKGASKIPFVFYVPEGYASNESSPIPNVEETDDPALIFTASFDGKEYWRDLRLSEIPKS